MPNHDAINGITPGPWRAEGIDIYRNDDLVASACFRGFDDQQYANARAIAALPDLLAACEAIANAAPVEVSEDLQRIARAAIAKATK